MATEQVNANEAITQAVAKATRVAIQVMAATGAKRTQNVGSKLGRPIMKQQIFN